MERILHLTRQLRAGLSVLVLAASLTAQLAQVLAARRSKSLVEIFAGAIPSTSANVSDSKGDSTNFVAKVTAAGDDTDTTLFDETGMWRIDNLPSDGTYVVRVGATNFATIQTTCTLSTPNADNNNSPANFPITSLGDVALTKAVSVTVNLSNKGAGVASCPIFAVPGASGEPAGSTNATVGGIEIAATTGTDGSATLAGLNPLLAYTIVAPACDSNNDGVYDFQTVIAALDSAIDSAATLQIQALPVGRNDAIALINTNATLVAGTGFPTTSLVSPLTTVGGIGDILSIGKSDNIVLVFNYPVSIASTPGISVEYLNNLISLTGVSNFPLSTSIAATCTLSAGNTVLTCDPASDLPVNKMLTLEGTVVANINSASHTTKNSVLNLNDLDSDATIDSWYVFDASTNGLSANTTLTADNYNGTSNGTSVGMANTVYLEFPELVYGTWNVIETTDSDPNNDGATTDSLTTAFTACSGNLTATASFLFEGNDPNTAGVVTGTATVGAEAAGCTGTTCPGTAVVYRVPMACLGALNDNETATGRTVLVFVDATDVEGNRRQGRFNLPVQ